MGGTLAKFAAPEPVELPGVGTEEAAVEVGAGVLPAV